MVGTTLTDIRNRVETLATDGGEYYVVCGRTGDRPVPAEGLRFESRTDAREAARATAQYRAALRRYDPRLPHYDLVVCQAADADRWDGATDAADQWTLSAPVVTSLDRAPARRDLVEFCHRVAAAVFETLAAGAHDGVERAVMDAYVEHAETVADPDDLCLRLLESLAAALDASLSPRAQADVLAGAADRLPPRDPGESPVDNALAALRDCRLVGEYTCTPAAMERDASRRTVTGELTDYALAPQNGRLPVLPIVVELCRRRPA